MTAIKKKRKKATKVNFEKAVKTVKEKRTEGRGSATSDLWN